MAETLDLAVARLAFAARAMERALHHPGPWTIAWGQSVVPATREVTEHEVVFRAEFPDQCYLVVPPPAATLRAGDDIVSVRDIEFPGDGPFVVEWALAPSTLQPA